MNKHSDIKKPKLVLFDYGHTLVYEECFDLVAGGDALYNNIISGADKISRDEFVQATCKLYRDMSGARRQLGLEVPADSFTRILREYYGIEFALDEIGVQGLYWDAVSPPVAMPGADEMLKYLSMHNIKTAVVSNVWYDSETLKQRIKRLLPNSDFLFYMSTCNYGLRKPARILFDIALKRAGCSPSEAWFCGDEPNADINGAIRAGITPIWFDCDINCPYTKVEQDKPEESIVHLKNWEEFMKLLGSCI